MRLDDADIMRRIQDGQLELFDELVLRYREPLIRVAESKLRDRALAEDTVQETFLAVFTSRQTYNPQFSFRTWLWTILLNLCRRKLKRQSRHPKQIASSVLEEAEPRRSTELDFHESGLGRLLLIERKQQLAALLDELPPPQADALRLRFFGELKFAEIARTMNCSLSGAKQRVRSGLAVLARRLRDEEGEGQ